MVWEGGCVAGVSHLWGMMTSRGCNEQKIPTPESKPHPPLKIPIEIRSEIWFFCVEKIDTYTQELYKKSPYIHDFHTM